MQVCSEEASSLTNARVDPEQALPTQAVVELRDVGAHAAAAELEGRPQDAEDGFAALPRRARAPPRQRVDGARLLVALQLGGARFVVLAHVRESVARRDGLPGLGPLGAHRVEFRAGGEATTRTVGFPA